VFWQDLYLNDNWYIMLCEGFNKFSQIREILKTQRAKKLNEIFEIIKKRRERGERAAEEKQRWKQWCQENAYATKDRHKKNSKMCYICGKLGYLFKDCYHRKNKSGQKISENSR